MKKLTNWFKKIFKIHEHDKQVFCVGNIAFVKCMSCGDESIPWRVSESVAEKWRSVNEEKLTALYTFKRKI